MRDACIKAVETALGRPATQAELRGIEERVANQMRLMARADPAVWRAMTNDQRYTEAGKGAAQELIAERAKKVERVGLAVLRQQANEAYIDDQINGGHDVNGVDALQRLLVPKNDFGNNTISVESRSNAMFRDAVRQIVDVFEAVRPGIWRFIPWEDRRIQRDMRRALAGDTKGVDPALVQAAKTFHEAAETLRQRFNEAGGVINRLDNWDQPHQWSARLALRHKADFADDFMRWIDRTKYVHEDGRMFDDGDMRAFLDEARLTIASDGMSKVRETHPGGAIKANRNRAHRQIHLRPEFTAEALAKYSDRNVMESMVMHLRRLSRDVALLETFGPNADLQFRQLLEKYQRDAVRADDAKAGHLAGKARYLQRVYDHLAGNNPPPESRAFSEGMAAFRSWQIASKLGSAAITSITDSATLALTNHVNNLNHFQVFLNTLNAWTPGGRRFAKRMALLTDTMVGEADRFAIENLTARDMSSKVASFVMRASALNFLTEARRVGFAVTMMDTIGHLTRRYADVSKVKPSDGRALASAGVDQATWDIWRQARLETRGANHSLLSPDAIMDLDSVPLRDRQRAVESLLAIVGQETDLAVIQPGVRERVQMSFGQETNSISGEIARTAFLFKSFPWALMQRHWERGLNGFEGAGRYAYMAALFTMMTMFGILANWINDILTGKDPRSLNVESKEGVRNIIAGFLKGGALGLYGDFMFSETREFGGGSLGEALLGPGVSTVSDALRLTAGNAVQALAGEETNIGGEAIDFARANTPGANIWYIKALTDRLIFQQLQELANPGYNSRRMRNQRRNQGTDYWWPLAEPAPERAPDIGAAIRAN